MAFVFHDSVHREALGYCFDVAFVGSEVSCNGFWQIEIHNELLSV
jgi:hypothetical protein